MKKSGAGPTIIRPLAVSVISLLMSSTGARAQDQATASQQGVEEIVVTAQKREESLQQVPISITAFKAEQLTQMGIQTTSDLTLIVPGFQISGSASNTLYYLRGVGTQQVGPGVSSEVVTFVDGVYMPFQYSLLQGFNNIRSIEVDKGPQGTLFGRNANGGVIQVATRDPRQDLTADLDFGYGSYNTFDASAYISGGITDRLSADLALYAHNQGDGYGINQVTGKGTIKNVINSARSKWIYNFSDDTSIRFIADYSQVTSDAGAIIRPAAGIPYLVDEVTGKPLFFHGFYNTDANTASRDKTYDTGFSLKFQTVFDWAQFSSTTSWRTNMTRIDVDFDGGPETFAPISNTIHQADGTEELQLSSLPSSPLTWVTGIFLLRDLGSTTPFTFEQPFPTAVFGLPPGTTYNIYSNTSTSSAAGYAQATATVLTDTHVTLGYRYTIDRKTIDGYSVVRPTIGVLPATVGSQRVDYSKPTFRVALDYDLTPDIKLYASYNRGFQSGNFNANNVGGFSRAANPPLYPETLDAYELGVKSEWFDHRLRANASAFHYDYRNLQQQAYNNNVLVSENAGAAEINGIDAELHGRPIPNLDLSLSGELLDAKFDTYQGAPIYSYGPNRILLTSPGSATNKYLPYAPAFTWTLAGNYYIDTSIGRFVTDLTLNYSSGWYADPGNLYKEPAYTVLNFSEDWMIKDNLDLLFYIKNLADTKYDLGVTAVAPVGFDGNIPGPPRLFGFTVRYHFDAGAEPAAAAVAAYVPPPVVAPTPAIPKSYLVFFDFNKSDLTPQALAIVDQAAGNAAHADVTKLEVTGHTDTVGSDAYNMRLSRRRAGSVAAELEKKGIPSNEIEIVAKGKRDLLVPTADGVREPQNRRVQIVCEGGPNG